MVNARGEGGENASRAAAATPLPVLIAGLVIIWIFPFVRELIQSYLFALEK